MGLCGNKLNRRLVLHRDLKYSWHRCYGGRYLHPPSMIGRSWTDVRCWTQKLNIFIVVLICPSQGEGSLFPLPEVSAFIPILQSFPTLRSKGRGCSIVGTAKSIATIVADAGLYK